MKPEEVYNFLNLRCFYCGHRYRHHLGVKSKEDGHRCLLPGLSIGLCDCPGWFYLESCFPSMPTAEDLYQALRVQDP